MSGELATCFQSVCQPELIKHEFPKFSLLGPRAHSAAKKLGHSHAWQVDRWTWGVHFTLGLPQSPLDSFVRWDPHDLIFQPKPVTSSPIACPRAG